MNIRQIKSNTRILFITGTVTSNIYWNGDSMDGTNLVDQLGAARLFVNVPYITNSTGAVNAAFNIRAGVAYIKSQCIGSTILAQSVNIYSYNDAQVYVETNELYGQCTSDTSATANNKFHITSDKMYYPAGNTGSGEMILKRVGTFVSRGATIINHTGPAATSTTLFNIEYASFDSSFVSSCAAYFVGGNGTVEGYFGQVEAPVGSSGISFNANNWSSTKPLTVRGNNFNLSVITSGSSGTVNIDCVNLVGNGGLAAGTSTLNIRALNHTLTNTYSPSYRYETLDFAMINLYGQTLTSSGNSSYIMVHRSAPANPMMVSVERIVFNTIVAFPAFNALGTASGTWIFKGKINTNNMTAIQIDAPATTRLIEQGLSLITGTADSIIGTGATVLELQGILATSTTGLSTNGTVNVGPGAFISNAAYT